jgi:hypothetical protein
VIVEIEISEALQMRMRLIALERGVVDQQPSGIAVVAAHQPRS